MIAPFVFVVAVRLAIVNDIQPVTSPPLAVARRVEQTCDESVVSSGLGVVDKLFDLLRL